jgi:glyoxylase-like metal-dependent hydrolase (beta-lactamase superfamily II)
VGAVCDPIDDPDLYVRLAEERKVNIRYVIDTHLHADHVSGGRKLAIGHAGRRLCQSEFLSRALLPGVQTACVRRQGQPKDA